VVYTDFLKVVIGHVGSKISSSDDFLDGFLFDWSYTVRSGWRLFV
jgi:hypothetical protein